MTNHILQKLALATAGVALSLAVVEAQSAHAAIITYDFTVDVTGGSLAGNSYSGFFSYDDTSVPPPRSASTVSPYFDVSEFNFNFADRTYTASDLRFDCRLPSEVCFPLVITGGEAVTKPTPPFTFLTPRGGTLQRVQFSNVGFTGFPSVTLQPLFLILGSPTTPFFAYQLPGESATFGSGNVRFSLRPPTQSVPEPSIVFGLSILGFGWLLRKKIPPFQRTQVQNQS